MMSFVSTIDPRGVVENGARMMKRRENVEIGAKIVFEESYDNGAKIVRGCLGMRAVFCLFFCVFMGFAWM